jgi:hypothetical protein
MDMSTAIKQYCHDCGIIIHKLESVPVYASFLDRMLGIKRETVYFHIEGNEAYLRNFQNHLEELAK